MAKKLLTVKGLKKHFPIHSKGFFGHTIGAVKAVNDISFELNTGETLGLVGESGCGKSTTGNCILHLLDPTDGEVLYHTENGQTIDLAKMPLKEIKPYRKEMQMVFQDPYSSLNPRMNVRQIITEPYAVFEKLSASEIQDRAELLMKKVGLPPEYLTRYPHAFSGGQRQRIGIARAIALNPRLIVCDECVSSLDVSVQAQVLSLLEELQAEYGMSYLFIAHDLSAVKHISDRVAVMYVGKIVEIADTDELYENPKHPYTEALLASVPKLDGDKHHRKMMLEGEVPDPSNPPQGCFFHPRCKYATEECRYCDQRLIPINPSEPEGHRTSCIRYHEITLKGVKKD